MTVETFLTKRRAKYKGEIGLFADSQAAEDDLLYASMDAQVRVILTSPKNVELLKFLWALATKVADNTELYIDKEEAMKDLKMRAGFQRHGKPKSLARVSNEKLRALRERVMFVVERDILPGVSRADLRREIEEMLRAA